MAKLAVIALGKRGVSHIQVVNRTLERAQRLAKMVNAQAATFERLPEILAQTDVLITSTGAPHTLISPTMVTSALQGRPDRPLVIMDIAVPRDVDVRVGEIEGVFLYDLDDLSGRLEESIRLRSQEVPKVKKILAEEQANFMRFFASLDVLPLIINLRQRADKIRRRELEKTLPRLSHLSPDERETVIAMSKSIVKKILHTPTVRLQSEANGPQAAEYANLTRFLFGLD
jgi:glutamyl-tRNA reductase